MSPETATRMAQQVGVATLVLGGALAAKPVRAGAIAGLAPRPAQVIGIADLALVPGLLAGRPRWPWMVGRAVLNVAIARHGLAASRAGAPRVGVVSRALLGITVVDSVAAATLARAGR